MENRQIKVSVIIPVYNVKPYLRQCLDSVVGQTLQEIEILCVDDESTDGSLQILEEYAKKDERIRIITQKNAGAGAARNKGLSQANGKYLSFLDSDDFFEPNMLAKAYEKAEQDQSDFVVYGSDQYHTEKNQFVKVDWVVQEKELPKCQPFNRYQITGNIFKTFVGWAWDKLFLKDFVDQHHLTFQEQRTSNDMLFVFSAIVLAKRISYVPETLAHQRRDAKDSLSKTREHSWQCFYMALNALKERLIQEKIYQELERDYINYALHFSLWNYNTLAEPTKSILKDKLKTEWFEKFGIKEKNSEFFYNQKEYRQYLDLMGLMETQTTTEKKASVKTQTGQNTMWKKIKSILREILPVGRAYIDKKWKAQKQELLKEIKKQELAQQKDYIQELNNVEHRILEEMESYVAKHSLQLEGYVAEKTEYLDNRNENRYQFQKNHTIEMGEQIRSLRVYTEQEFVRRDNWGKMAAEIKRTAEGRQIWVIKCPAPEGDAKKHWGDYYYALALQKYLERKGKYVVMDTRQDWNCEEGADVVLVLRGLFSYRPDRRNEKCLYIMWNISHPDMVSKAEYELYDVVCVGSRYMAEKLKKEVKVPVVPLLQCTDTELFCPEGEKDEKYSGDYIFVGSTRGVMRDCALWAAEDHLPLHIWGGGWEKMLPDHPEMIEGQEKANEELPALYRAAKVTLNDHWKDMLEHQIVNNRIFDALACGLPVISDGCEEMKEIFPDAVLYYSNKEEFDACVQKMESNYDAIKAKALEQYDMIKKEYSFERRVEELIAICDQYHDTCR